MSSLSIDDALRQFDATDANVRRLASIWSEMCGIVPADIAFGDSGPEGDRFRELTWAFDAIVDALPAISGFRITAKPMGLNEIAQGRLDAADIGEIEVAVRLNEDMSRPGSEIAEYRFRLDRARRELVRNRVSALASEIDRQLADLTSRHERNSRRVDDPVWTLFVGNISQVERLAGSQVPRTQSWTDLERHVRFAQGHDLHDIKNDDWPAVREELAGNLYSDLEPLPLVGGDLGVVSASDPGGEVSSALKWANIGAGEFERLLFNLLSDAPEYENVQWLTHTEAPDRGRDISTERVRSDSLSGTIRERVIVQARHWLSRSIGVKDMSGVVSQMDLWEPPPIDVLVIATDGRFSADAVAWAEKRNSMSERPRIEMWPENHLELLLARRPHIAAALGLR